MSTDAPKKALRLIDTDVHHSAKPGVMEGYMSPVWKGMAHGDVGALGSFRGSGNPHGVERRDATPLSGGAAGSCIPTMREQLLDKYEMDYAVLTPAGAISVGVHPHLDYAAARASAFNEWQNDHWWSADPRFLGSILITPQNPEAAVKEIKKWAGHPKVKQTIMTSATQVPFGHRQYWPIYAAACEAGLPVAMHPGAEGTGISNVTAAGYPDSYLEWHTNLSQNYMAQVSSLVLRGVFCEFPTLRIVGLEGGFGWLPHLMWRMDKNWKALRITAPWLKKAPSEYVVEHIRLSTQPVEEPPERGQLEQMLAMCHADKVLMFSSDYPHWDNDCPVYAFPKLPEALRERILWANAAELYGITGPAEGIPAPVSAAEALGLATPATAGVTA